MAYKYPTDNPKTKTQDEKKQKARRHAAKKGKDTTTSHQDIPSLEYGPAAGRKAKSEAEDFIKDPEIKVFASKVLKGVKCKELQSLDKDDIFLITMNVGTAKISKGSRQRRRVIINAQLSDKLPSIFFLQEYTWEKNDQYIFSEMYHRVGNTEASIMYFDDGRFQYVDLNGIARKILDTLKSNGNNASGSSFPNVDFVSRCCCYVMQYKDKPKFIAVSYHGQWNGIKDKIYNLKMFLTFMDKVRTVASKKQEVDLPMIIGGDWNVNYSDIEKSVSNLWTLYRYGPSKRRRKVGVKDYFIATHKDFFNLRDMGFINVGETDWLDHDPIKATAKIKPYKATAKIDHQGDRKDKTL